MKRALTAIVSVFLVVSVTGCGGSKKHTITPTLKPTPTISTSATPVATPIPTLTVTPTISTPSPVSTNNITDDELENITVYVTNSGKKYHQTGCQYLSNSKIAISLDEAELEGYEPCSKCF